MNRTEGSVEPSEPIFHLRDTGYGLVKGEEGVRLVHNGTKVIRKGIVTFTSKRVKVAEDRLTYIAITSISDRLELWHYFVWGVLDTGCD